MELLEVNIIWGAVLKYKWVGDVIFRANLKGKFAPEASINTNVPAIFF